MKDYSKIIMAIYFFVLVGFVMPGLALPPEMEADRLLISASNHLGSPEATVEFEKIRSLKVKLPTEYYYQYGKHLYHLGSLKNIQEASKNIETYLKKAGRDGYYYPSSLKLITTIEKKLANIEEKRVAAEREQKLLEEEIKKGRFVAQGNGTVIDTKNNLMWAAKDSGRDSDHYSAPKYCNEYEGGGYIDWRLPTLSELASLYDSQNTNKNGYKITRLINISGHCFWSSNIGENDSAAVMNFENGNQFWSDRIFARIFSRCNFHVLPVRNVTEKISSEEVLSDKSSTLQYEETYNNFHAAITNKGTFIGKAWSQKDTWPCKINLYGFKDDSGHFEGEIHWLNLDAIHKISGRLSNENISFKEVGFIKKGKAALNCRYNLSLLAKNNIITGGWRCGSSGGVELSIQEQ